MKTILIPTVILSMSASGADAAKITWFAYVSEANKPVVSLVLTDEYQSLIKTKKWSCYTQLANTDKDASGKVLKFDRDFICANSKSGNRAHANIECKTTQEECKGSLYVGDKDDFLNILYVGKPY